MIVPAEPMAPLPSRVLAARRESHDVVTLTVERGVAPPAPGQFNMLYAFGVGEVPISTSGDPAAPDVLVHTIKSVGHVSEALCNLGEGATLGVRGPFGTPWPLEAAEGADLLVVAGGLGLAPLRPVLYDALARRSAYGRVALLAGARTPEDLLYRPELDRWSERADVTVLQTVDHATVDWEGRVGVVPALLPELEARPGGFDAQRTVALVCGPEVMMRYTVRALLRMGVGAEQIYLSLERNMKCAIGFCGHCQYGPSFLCKDGPVFRYDRIMRRFSIAEV